MSKMKMSPATPEFVCFVCKEGAEIALIPLVRGHKKTRAVTEHPAIYYVGESRRRLIHWDPDPEHLS